MSHTIEIYAPLFRVPLHGTIGIGIIESRWLSIEELLQLLRANMLLCSKYFQQRESSETLQIIAFLNVPVKTLLRPMSINISPAGLYRKRGPIR